jgi:protein associated with RNAse G/E
VAGTLHYRLGMTLPGEDEAGVWAGSVGGAQVQRGNGTRFTSSADAVTLFPAEHAWAARWHAQQAGSGRAARFWCYVDIATPASRTSNVLRLVDLDLDVALTWDGEIVGLDEDEFACNRVLFGYPERIIKQASEAFSEVKERLADQLFPFDGSADQYTTAWFSAQPGH